MKCIGQSKYNDSSKIKRIQKIIINDDERNHFITTFFNSECNNISSITFNDDINNYLHLLDVSKPLIISELPKINKIEKVKRPRGRPLKEII